MAQNEQAALILELRQRERTLIDLCHKVDAKLQQLPATPEITEIIADLEQVRFWWYPVPPPV